MVRREEIVEAYLAALRESVICSDGPGGRLRVTTPLLYPDNDNVVVFVRTGTTLAVSDLGEALRKLSEVGLGTNGGEGFAEFVRQGVASVGAEVVNGIIFKRGTPGDAGRLILDVSLACQRVGSYPAQT